MADDSIKYSMCDEDAWFLLKHANIVFENHDITSECLLSQNGFSFSYEDYSCIQEQNIDGVNIPSKSVIKVLIPPLDNFVLVAVYKRGPYIYAYWSGKETIIKYELNCYLLHTDMFGAQLVTIHDDNGVYLWGHIEI